MLTCVSVWDAHLLKNRGLALKNAREDTCSVDLRSKKCSCRHHGILESQSFIMFGTTFLFPLIRLEIVNRGWQWTSNYTEPFASFSYLFLIYRIDKGLAAKVRLSMIGMFVIFFFFVSLIRWLTYTFERVIIFYR